MNWEILPNDESITHFHDPIHVWILDKECPLCKEKVPDHILLQLKLLNIDHRMPGSFIDFYTGHAPSRAFSFFYGPTNTLSLRTIYDRSLHDSIINLFKVHGFKDFKVNLPGS